MSRTAALLDRILSRASQLDTLTDFSMDLSLSDVGREVERVTRPLSSSHRDLDRGERLLANEGCRDIGHALNSLRRPGRTDVVATTFNEFSRSCFEKCIVELTVASEKEIERKNSVRLAEVIARKLGVKKVSDYAGTYLLFFASLLVDSQGSPAKRFAKAARSESTRNSGLFETSVRDAMYNTFDIIRRLESCDDQLVGSLRFLERQMKRDIIVKVESEPRPPRQKKGSVTFLVKIKIFVELNESLKGNQWAVLYYALRCGMDDIAFEYVREHGADFDSTVVEAVRLRKCRTVVPAQIRDSLIGYIGPRVVAGDNMHKVAVLSVLAAKDCMPDDNRWCVEDWLWFNMSVRPDVERIRSKVDRMIKMDADTGRFDRGQLLLLSNRYDEAAKWFLDQENGRELNVHIVLSMCAGRLVDAALVMPSIISTACSVFKKRPDLALLYFLDHNLVNISREQRVQAIAAIAVSVKNGHTLMEPFDGGCCLVSRVVDDAEKHDITEAAGELADSRGRHGDAARFFRLARNYNRLAELACESLVLSMGEKGSDATVQNAVDLCDEICENSIAISPNLDSEMKLLMSIAWANVLLGQGDYTRALLQLQQSDVLSALSEAGPEQPRVVRAMSTSLMIASKAIEMVKVDGNGNEQLVSWALDALRQSVKIPWLPSDVQKSIVQRYQA